MRRIMALVAALTVLLLMNSCGTAEMSKRTALVHDDARIRDLLLDSWMTDGSRGFFVEDAWSDQRSPFSLYDTHWNLKLAEFDPERAIQLNPSRIARWLAAALAGQLGGSSLPPMIQIRYAVEISERLRIPVNGNQVANALESLRDADRYRTGGESKPNWGSTALAVEALGVSGLPVPSQVIEAVQRYLSSPAPVPSPASVVEDLGPALRAAAALNGAGVARKRLAQLVNEAAYVLAATPPDIVSLAAFAEIRTVAARLRVTVPRFPFRCASLLRSDGTIGVPGAREPDPQLTYLARSVGCQGTVLPPAGPYSRAGWPHPHSIESSVKATVAGLWLAADLGVEATYRERVKLSLFEVWLPEYRLARPENSLARLAGAASLSTLAVLVKAERDPRVDALSADHTSAPADDLGRMYAMVTLSHAEKSPAQQDRAPRLLAQEDAGQSVLTSATAELAARITGSGDLHHRAAKIVRALRHTNGAYGFSIQHPDDVSLTATAFAAWVLRQNVPLQVWTQIGVCQGDRCADSPQGLNQADNASLQTLALTRACSTAAQDDLFPLIL